jgi:hypothetical protein
MMLTGRRLVSLNQPDNIGKLLHIASSYKKTLEVGGDFPGLAELQPIVPARLEAVVRRSLALRPEDRFRDAGEMLAALDAAMVPERTGVPPERDAPRPDSLDAQPTQFYPADHAPPPDSLDAQPTQLYPGESEHKTTLVWSRGSNADHTRVGTFSSTRGLMLLGFGVALLAAVVTAAVILAWHEGQTSPESVAAVGPAAQEDSPPPAKESLVLEPEAVSDEIPDNVAKEPSVPREVVIPVEPESSKAVSQADPMHDEVRVRIIGLPDEARVFFMGRERPTLGGDTGRWAWVSGPEGSRGMLTVEADGYPPYSETITLRSNRVIDLSTRLRRSRGRPLKTTLNVERQPDSVIQEPRLKTSLPNR